MSGSIQLFRKMKRFSPGGSTHIHNIAALLWGSDFSYKHGADILYGKKTFPEAGKAAQIIIPCNRKGVRQIWMAFDCHSFCSQPLHQFLQSEAACIAADRHRFFFLEISQYFLYCIHIIFGQPFSQNPLGHGISDRQFSHRVLGIFCPAKSPGCTSQHSVYKSFQRPESFFYCKLHRLVAHRRIRYTVHVFQLIYGTPQNISDNRLHFFDLYF